MDMLHCEWLEKLVIIDNISRTISIKALTQDQLTPKRYNVKPHCERQLLSSQFIKCLACKSIVDSSSGWKTPHLLVTHAPQQNRVLHEILACDSNGLFEPCELKFEVERGTLSEERSYDLLDGPTVVWTEGTYVHMVRGARMEQEVSIDLRTTAPEVKVERIGRLWCVTSIDENDRSCVLLLMQLLLKETDHHLTEFGTARKWMCLEVQLQEANLSLNFDPLVVSGTKACRVPDVIPSDYGCVATCVAPHKSVHFDVTTGALLERVQFLVGTEYQQVVMIEGGAVSHVIPLQYTPRQVTAVKVHYYNPNL